MVAWLCINHTGRNPLCVQAENWVNTSANRDATINSEKGPCHCPTTLANGRSVTAFSFQIHIFFFSAHFKTILVINSAPPQQIQSRRQNCHYFIISQARPRCSPAGIQLSLWNVLISRKDAIFKTITPHLTCTMKQPHGCFMTFKDHIVSNPEELATISSINSINLSLLHQFQLVLMVSADSGKAATTVPAKTIFSESNFIIIFFSPSLSV